MLPISDSYPPLFVRDEFMVSFVGVDDDDGLYILIYIHICKPTLMLG